MDKNNPKDSEQTQQHPPKASNKPLLAVTIGMLLIFPPAGLLTMWLGKIWSKNVRIVVSVLAAMWTLFILASDDGIEPVVTRTETTAPNKEAPASSNVAPSPTGTGPSPSKFVNMLNILGEGFLEAELSASREGYLMIDIFAGEELAEQKLVFYNNKTPSQPSPSAYYFGQGDGSDESGLEMAATISTIMKISSPEFTSEDLEQNVAFLATTLELNEAMSFEERGVKYTSNVALGLFNLAIDFPQN